MRLYGWLGSLIAGLMVCFSGVSAQAGCDNPLPELLWMSPSKNAVDVPTNAELIVVVPPEIPLAVYLDDQPLGTLENGAFGPLGLSADTTYKVRVELGEGATVKKIISQFTTGSHSVNDVVNAPTLNLSAEPPSDTCSHMAQSQWCVNDQQTMVVLSANSEGVGLHVTDGDQTTRWSAECMPQVPADRSACYQISTLSVSGAVSLPVEHCVSGSPSSSGGGGCAISAIRSGRASVLPMACALLGFLAFLKRMYGQDD